MARNFFRIFTENNPVMGYSKTFFIPEAKGLTTMPVCWECVWHMCAMWYHLSNGRKSGWRTRASAFLISGFFFAMKQCPIAAKITGSIGILPCCALNDFHIRVWTFTRFVRPLLATILCTWELYPRVYNVSSISLLATKKVEKWCITTPILKPKSIQNHLLRLRLHCGTAYKLSPSVASFKTALKAHFMSVA